MEYLAIGVSVVALVISMLAWRETRRQADAAERGNQLSEQEQEAGRIAARSANLVLDVELVNGRQGLVVRNDGMATARRVNLATEVPFGDHGELPMFVGDPFPCDIPRGGNVARLFVWAPGMAEHLQVAVTWTDDEGDHETTARLSIL